MAKGPRPSCRPEDTRPTKVAGQPQQQRRRRPQFLPRPPCDRHQRVERRPQRTERDRPAMADGRDNHRRNHREPQSNQQWSENRHGHPEASYPLQECAEDPAEDESLKSPVHGQVGKATAHRRNGPCLIRCPVEEQSGPDDVEDKKSVENAAYLRPEDDVQTGAEAQRGDEKRAPTRPARPIRRSTGGQPSAPRQERWGPGQESSPARPPVSLEGFVTAGRLLPGPPTPYSALSSTIITRNPTITSQVPSIS